LTALAVITRLKLVVNVGTVAQATVVTCAMGTTCGEMTTPIDGVEEEVIPVGPPMARSHEASAKVANKTVIIFTLHLTSGFLLEAWRQ
jgi:hypothetical protein